MFCEIHVILQDILLIAHIFALPCGAQKNATQLVKYPRLFICSIVSGRYPVNPDISLVPGAGSIFLSPDHGHGNQLR